MKIKVLQTYHSGFYHYIWRDELILIDNACGSNLVWIKIVPFLNSNDFSSWLWFMAGKNKSTLQYTNVKLKHLSLHCEANISLLLKWKKEVKRTLLESFERL